MRDCLNLGNTMRSRSRSKGGEAARCDQSKMDVFLFRRSKRGTGGRGCRMLWQQRHRIRRDREAERGDQYNIEMWRYSTVQYSAVEYVQYSDQIATTESLPSDI